MCIFSLNKNHFIKTLILLFIIISFTSCDNIDKQWHNYKSDNLKIIGKNKDDIKIISHRWKLLGKLSSKYYEWGWKVTIKTIDSEPRIKKLVGISGIKYTLQDKNGFELVSSNLNLDDYNRVIWSDGEKGPILQEYGQTKIYKQTSKITLQQVKRAYSGSCYIYLSN